ncbi:MAG: LysM peptidoglycan-binding domain-containing M23 family metallopeptidase [Pseudomonadota bacterium]|nr:LysM peptidoglycan-binding domain-containing M23 family metallopeptidase [Pseudomonadota bacterium]
MDRRAVILLLALLPLACAPDVPPGPPPVVLAGASRGVDIIVRHGDTAWSIARKAGVPLRDLIAANGLVAPYTLLAGQQLRLPELRLHRVQPGESLSSVAELYDVGRDEIVRLNDMVEPWRLHPNQILKIPGGRRDGGIVTAIARAPAGSVPPLPPPRPRDSAIAAAPEPSAPAATTARPAEPAPHPATTARPASARPGGPVWPVRGRVLSAFGAKPGGLHNDGINIAAPVGTPVRVMERGRVVYAGNELKGFGNLVLVRHPDGRTSAYAHLGSIDVERDAELQRGDVLGTVGTSGGVSPPQLHFQVRERRKAVDPARLLGGSPLALDQSSGISSRPARS